MQAIYHGHSFVEIETEQGSILIDPFITGNQKCDISLENIFSKKITHIILTHGHSDHVGDTIEIAKNIPDCMVIGIVQLIDWIKDQWITNTWCVQQIGDIFETSYFSIKFVQADHPNANPDGWDAGLSAWLIISIWSKVIYHAGDTILFDDMKEFQSDRIDLAFLPIGGHYTMDSQEAVKVAWLIHAKMIVPIHYNTWPDIKTDDIEFARQIMLKQYGVPKVLRAGQYVVL